MIEAALADLRSRNLVSRIWRGDHTVWKPDPTEIADRLGWLTITDRMRDRVSGLEAFAAEVKDEGYRHVVLLGMGGSSLGTEVIGQTFGSAAGYPKLIVLDSTIPDSVQAVSDEIDPVRTLFLVSSKSGTTIEPLAFYNHFRSLVDAKAAERVAGQRFAAITDPGTSLERVAELDRFRRVFLNASDIGGRYSVLSYFGMVPAALAGVDIAKLLERADGMRDSCAPYVDVNDNPGARLGAVMASHAAQGRDKLSLVLSPSITGFGLWVEQLIAESTGKEGRGIIPVVGEPLAGPSCYGDDRLFVYLRLDGDNNGDLDAAMADLESAGQPVVRLELGDKYDLGAEFFRWQFATAVAGSVLGIHPFDQPDVQQAKDETARGSPGVPGVGQAATAGGVRLDRRVALPSQAGRLPGYTGLCSRDPGDQRGADGTQASGYGALSYRHHRGVRPAVPSLYGPDPQGRPQQRPVPADQRRASG